MTETNPYGKPISNEELADLRLAARGLAHHSAEALRVEVAVASRRWEQDRKLSAYLEARAAARNAVGLTK